MHKIGSVSSVSHLKCDASCSARRVPGELRDTYYVAHARVRAKRPGMPREAVVQMDAGRPRAVEQEDVAQGHPRVYEVRQEGERSSCTWSAAAWPRYA